MRAPPPCQPQGSEQPHAIFTAYGWVSVPPAAAEAVAAQGAAAQVRRTDGLSYDLVSYRHVW
jgi:hypothetical protein